MAQCPGNHGNVESKRNVSPASTYLVIWCEHGQVHMKTYHVMGAPRMAALRGSTRKRGCAISAWCTYLSKRMLRISALTSADFNIYCAGAFACVIATLLIAPCCWISLAQSYACRDVNIEMHLANYARAVRPNA